MRLLVLVALFVAHGLFLSAQCVISTNPVAGSSFGLANNPQTASPAWDLHIPSIAHGLYFLELEVSGSNPLKNASVASPTNVVLVSATAGGGAQQSNAMLFSGNVTFKLHVNGVLNKCKSGTVTFRLFTITNSLVCSVSKSLHTMGQNHLVIDNTTTDNGDIFFMANDFNAFKSITLLPGFDFDAQVQTSGTFDIVSGCAQQKKSLAKPGEHPTEEAFSVFPNPVTTMVTVSNPGSSIRRYTILSMVGKFMDSKVVSEDVTRVDMSDYPSGFYIMNVETVDGQSHVLKLIKQ